MVLVVVIAGLGAVVNELIAKGDVIVGYGVVGNSQGKLVLHVACTWSWGEVVVASCGQGFVVGRGR